MRNWKQLQIDARTSRLVGEAVRSGSVERVASQQDGRRIHLRLTDEGRDLLATSRRFQQDIFEELTRDWSDRDKHELARLMIKLAEDARPAGTDKPGA